MKGLFVTNPGIGHFHPMVPIARALEDVGHEVAFACALDFHSYVESAGFRAFPAGLNWLEFEAEKAFPQIRKLALDRMELWFLTEVFAGVAARQMCPSLLDLCDSWKPDFLLCNDFEFGTHIVAERTDTPYATLGIGLYLPGRALSSVIRRQIAELRASHGLPPDPELSKLHRHLYLSWLPRRYHFPNTPHPRAFQALRAPGLDDVREVVPPSWIDELQNQPTVLATLGTVFNKTSEATEVYSAILEALRDEPVNLILTVGPGQNPERFGPSPANVKIVQYISHSFLLPHCDLVITHGGFATTRALSLGLPVIVIPLNGDHVFHAMRCSALGVGCAVKRQGQFDTYLDDTAFADLSAEAIRVAVRKLLQVPDYRQNAQRLALEMKSLPGPDHAVTLLEKLVRERSCRQ